MGRKIPEGHKIPKRMLVDATKEILDDYKKRKGDWTEYERKFLDLMAERKIEELNEHDLDGGCLLCSEDKPHRCHRRLVAEYLREKWGAIQITHL